MFLIPSLAFARTPIYVALQGGGTELQSASNTGPGLTSRITVDSDYSIGYNVAFRAGEQFPGGWRAEWEVGYMNNDVDTLTVKHDGGVGQYLLGHSLNGTKFDAQGRVWALIGMVNVLYDFLPNERWHPYIGAGLGAANIGAHDVGALGVTVVHDSTVAFAYQAIAGLEMDLTADAGLYLNYHYLSAVHPELTDTLGEKFTTQYDTNNVSIGLRYLFR